MPETFQVLMRMVHVDSAIDARWEGPGRIVITAPRYRGNLSPSSDLRHYDPPFRGLDPVTLQTPLGTLRALRAGEGLTVTLVLSPAIDAAAIKWFYYSSGGIRELAK
jgi:hypothetical protein